MKRIEIEKKKLIIACASVASVLMILFAAAAQLPRGERIARGVRIDGESVAGMTVDEAREVISSHNFYDGMSFVLTCGEISREINGEEVALCTDVDKTAERAYSVGRGKGIFANMFASVRSALGGCDITSCAGADEEALDAIIYEMGVEKNGEIREAQLKDVTDEYAVVVPPTSGQLHDVSRERAQVLESLPQSPVEIAPEASVPEKLSAQELYAVIYRPSENAEYLLEDGKLYIKDETVGIEPDKEDIAAKLAEFNGGNEITVKAQRTVPEVTAAELREGLFTNELASYKSTYSTAAVGRAYNVARAASSINGKILLPGDTFSYNDTIGNPSLANGYRVAPIYENGKTSEGVGGGVCQVSSTLYSAVLYANLQIVERRSHSLTVAYVPKGQDATVAYGSVDFKFKNDTDRPIRIDASASGGKCVVKIVGTAPDVRREVKITHTVAASTEPTVTEIPDSSMEEGSRKVKTAGKTGYVIDSVRTVYENGEAVKTERLSRSTYKMMPTEVSVGTMPAATPASVAPEEVTPEEELPAEE